ncbi:MAG: hypothetical protein KC910_22460, partial [Candidatus Eremiobacteraeota bacterium]|nr:hypothetical protein [Candidatus Eremiobacteraeota bacterium]
MRWTAWLLILALLTACSGGPADRPVAQDSPAQGATSEPLQGDPDPPLPPAPAHGGTGGISRPDKPPPEYNPDPGGQTAVPPGQRPQVDQTPPPTEESPEQWRKNHRG